MLSSVRQSVDCNVRAPYSRDWNFRQSVYNIWYPGHPLVDIQVKFDGDRTRGTPPLGELNTKAVVEYSDLDLSNAISRKRCKIWAKLVLITNRKWHISFRLVPNSVTLDDLVQRNSPTCRVISPNSVAFRADYVRLKIHQYFLQRKCRPRIQLLAIHHLWWYWQGITPVRALKRGTPLSVAKIWPIISHNLETVQDSR